jgi:hypothetical protein
VSASARRGPSRPLDRDSAEERAARRRRAAEEPLDVRLASREPVVEVEVRNPIHRTSYRVLFPEFPGRGSALCTCTDFARRDLGTCKHIEAAWSWLEGQAELPELPAAPERPVAELWREADRRLAAMLSQGPKRIRDVERVGAVLFEPLPEKKAGEEVGPARRRDGPTTSTSRARP